MADTRKIKDLVEPYVRNWLASKFGQPFHSEFLTLSGVKDRPGKHEFDAVTEDRKIVCGIKTASWTTSGRKRVLTNSCHAPAEEVWLRHILPSLEASA